MAVLWAYYEMGSSIMLENCNFDKDPAKGEEKQQGFILKDSSMLLTQN